jgi:hypothetical protein
MTTETHLKKNGRSTENSAQGKKGTASNVMVVSGSKLVFDQIAAPVLEIMDRSLCADFVMPGISNGHQVCTYYNNANNAKGHLNSCLQNIPSCSSISKFNLFIFMLLSIFSNNFICYMPMSLEVSVRNYYFLHF